MKTFYLKQACVNVKRNLLPVMLFLAIFTIGTQLKAQSPSMAKLAVQLLLNNNGGSQNLADGFVVVFDSAFTSAVGPEDSYKFSNLDENIAIDRNGVTLSVEGRPTVVDHDTVPVKIWQYRHTSYCLKFLATNFSNDVVAVLKDNYLQQDIPIDLHSNTVINYTLTSDSASYSPDRLCIVFKPAGTLPLGLTGFTAFTKDKGVQVEWKTENDMAISYYTVERSANSREFYSYADKTSKGSVNTETYSWYDASPLRGTNYYRIKITEKNGSVKYSSVVKVNTNNSNTGLTVFPNPVRGNTIGLQLQGLPEGIYTAYLYNNTGQVVYSRIIQHTGGSASQMLTIEKAMKPGTYVLQIKNKDNFISNNLIFH